MSSSSVRKGRNNEKAAKSNKKVAAAGKPERFGSKFVQPIIDDIGRSVLNESAKNNVAKDWVRKMSKSVLKKISEGSISAFSTSEHNVDELQNQIEQLHKTIDAQFTRLKENPHSRTKLPLQATIPAERAYTSGLYESQFQSIQDKVQRLSDEINSAKTAVESRWEILDGNVSAMRTNVDHFAARVQILNASNANTAPTTIPTTAVPTNTPAPSVASTSTAATARSQSQQQQTSSAQNSSTNSSQSNNTNNNGGRKRSQGLATNKQDPLHKMVDHLG